MVKQKAKLFSLFAGVLVFVSFGLVAFPSTANAIYTVSAGAPCQNGTPSKSVTIRGTTTWQCDDSTKSATPAGGTATPASGDAAATGDAAGKTDADEGVTCAVEKIGWILCPIIEGAAKISDKAFELLADNFLRVDPQLVSDDNNGTKLAWEIARNLANIMFIIAFLIIILSQVTGRGLNNYGIKKMLPRLIIAAIAVNLSYYICQLAVDLTNILGYEIQNAMAQIANTVGPSVFGQASNYTDTQTDPSQSGVLMTLIVTGALAAGAVVFFMLPTIIALVPLILITVMTIIIILLLRKALIVLLIVISPIAFVLYLLPNTEKYFSKWMSMFGKLLMVFPTVGLLFGAGQLASTIILVAGSNSNQAQYAAQCNPDDQQSKDEFNANKKEHPSNNSICGEKSIIVQGGKNGDSTCFAGAATCGVTTPRTTTWTLGLVAMGVAVAPLLAVWGVLQGALSAAGAIGGRIASTVSKGVGGLGKPANSAAGALSKRMKENRTAGWQRMQARGLDPKNQSAIDGIAGGFAKRRGDRALRQNLSKQALDRATNHAVNTPANVGGLTGGLTKSESERALRSVSAQEDHHVAEEIKNAEIDISKSSGGDMGKVQEALKNAISENDETKAKAAQNLLFSMGGAGVDAFVSEMKNKSGAIADAIAENTRLKHGGIKGTHAGLNEWANGSDVVNADGSKRRPTVDEAMGRASAFSNLSADNIAGQSTGSLAAMKKAIDSATATYNDTSKTIDERNGALAQAQGIKKAAAAAMQSKSIEGAKIGNKSIINDMANHTF